MESPKSEKMDTRYSTPVSELHDHRVPPAAQSRIVASPLQERAMLGASGPSATPVADSAPVARDFEHAIIDEDNANEFALFSPVSPNVGRHSMRRVTHQLREEHAKSSASSERSSSPPDSIDAFAEPRRRERTNTIGSRHPSELEEIQRTISGGTHRRRPTFDHPGAKPTAVFTDDLLQSPEPTDVDNLGRVPRIDYEALEEFVAESRRGRTVAPGRKKYSFSAQGRQLPNGPLLTPRVLRQSPSPMGRVTTADESHWSDEKAPAADQASEKVANGGQMSEKAKLSPDWQDRFTFFSTEIEKAIHAPDMPGLLDSGERLRDLFELVGEEGAWWLDVINPTKQELEVFEKAFGIHRLTTEDINEKETREKVELFQTYYFVCFRSYDGDAKSEDYLEPINLYLVVFREGILSFSYAPNSHAAGVRQRIGNRKDTESLTADWICYAMVDNIVDFYFPALRRIERETEQIEDQVFVARAEDFSQLLRQIGECRRHVMTLMRLLGGKADVIKGFAKRCNAQYSVTPRVEIGLYLSDIQDHVVTMMSNLGHFEKMLSRCHANYLAQLSVDHLRSGNRANEALSRITFIASILVPLNLIVGFFGMNIPLPGSINEGSYNVCYGILAVMGFVIVGAITVGRCMRYI